MRKTRGIMLVFAICLLLGATSVMAETGGVVSSFSSVIEVHTVYNAFGIAVSGKTITTNITSTTDAEGKVSKTVTVTTVDSTFKGGSLTPDKAVTTSTTTDANGRVTASSTYTDTYSYDSFGNLTGVSGSGTYSTTSYDKDGKITGSSKGTITRTFEIRDGQALLMSQTSSGTTYDKDGVKTGVEASTTTYSNWVYAGGQWLSNTTTTVSTTNMLNGSWSTVTKIINTTRDAYGTITGMSGSISGSKFDATAVDANGHTGITYTIAAISGQNMLEFALHPQLGWYLAAENYQWVSNVG